MRAFSPDSAIVMVGCPRLFRPAGLGLCEALRVLRLRGVFPQNHEEARQLLQGGRRA